MRKEIAYRRWEIERTSEERASTALGRPPLAGGAPWLLEQGAWTAHDLLQPAQEARGHRPVYHLVVDGQANGHHLADYHFAFLAMNGQNGFASQPALVYLAP